MEDRDDGSSQEQIDEHSLPGTNQAGKGPASAEKEGQQDRPGGERAQRQEQLEKHSLPGTNQAGKGPTTPDPHID